MSGRQSGYDSLSLSESIKPTDEDGKKDFAWLLLGGSQANIVGEDLTWIRDGVTEQQVEAETNPDKKYQMHMVLLMQELGGMDASKIYE